MQLPGSYRTCKTDQNRAEINSTYTVLNTTCDAASIAFNLPLKFNYLFLELSQFPELDPETGVQ